MKRHLFKGKYIAWMAAAALAAGLGWYLWGSGGIPLTTLTPNNFDQFTRDFNRKTNDVRLVLLLSPT